MNTLTANQLALYLEGEIWKPIPGHDGYEASNRQRIRSTDKVVGHNYGGVAIKKGKVLSQHINSNGYKAVGLCSGSLIKTCLSHRLIAFAWIPNPENKATINHKDGDKLNNSIDNLEWATQAENIQHAWRTKLSGNFIQSEAQKTARIEAAKKPVQAKDFRSGTIKHYSSITDCALDLGVTQSCVSASMIRGNRVQRKFEVKYSQTEQGLAFDKTKLK
jgi:hypothetical protein